MVVVIAISLIEIAVALVPVVMVRKSLSMRALYRVPVRNASNRLTRSSRRYVVLRKSGTGARIGRSTECQPFSRVVR